MIKLQEYQFTMTDDIYHDSFLGGLTLTDPFIIIIPLMLPSHRVAQARSLQIQNFTAFNRGGRAVASNYELGFFIFLKRHLQMQLTHTLYPPSTLARVVQRIDLLASETLIGNLTCKKKKIEPRLWFTGRATVRFAHQ